MANFHVYYVGTEDEVAHHAAPLHSHIDVRIACPEEVTRLAKPNDLAIFYSEHFHRFRKAWLQLHERGCHTIYAIDGILEWRNAWENRHDEPACPWTMRPVLSDKVACIGSSQARILDGWGNRGKTEVVGIPRFDAVGDSEQLPCGDANRPFRFLVTTAKWPAFTDQQRRVITQSLCDLRDFFSENTRIAGRAVEVVWRVAGGLDKVLGVENHLSDITGREINELLEQVDAVITTPSTVMLEAMLHDLPVTLLDYTNSPEYVHAAWTIRAREHMQPVIHQLIEPPQRRLQLQKSLLHDSLQLNESAAARLAQLAQEMIRIGYDCQSAGRPVEFPAQILPPQQESRRESNVCQAAASLKCLEGKDSHEYAAVAAEALRWFDRLHEHIDELECELSKAAEGFEQIASHPVLAPLLKVRKAALGMGGRIVDVLAAGRKMKKAMPPEMKSDVQIKT